MERALTTPATPLILARRDKPLALPPPPTIESQVKFDWSSATTVFSCDYRAHIAEIRHPSKNEEQKTKTIQDKMMRIGRESELMRREPPQPKIRLVIDETYTGHI